MTTLSQELRESCAGGWSVGLPEIVQTAKSVDGTERYLMRMADGETVETVWMPDGDGGERGDGSEAAARKRLRVGMPEEAVEGCRIRRAGLLGIGAGMGGDRSRTLARWRRRDIRRATICISSQVGCAVNCQFCLTAKLGIRRNLTAGEIAGQVAAVLNRHGADADREGSRINLVFMGMGEPFLNYDEFMQSVRLLVEGWGFRSRG